MEPAYTELVLKQGPSLALMKCVGAPIKFPPHVIIEKEEAFATGHNQFMMVPVEIHKGYEDLVTQLQKYGQSAYSYCGYFHLYIQPSSDGVSLDVVYRISDRYYWDYIHEGTDWNCLAGLGKKHSSWLFGAIAHLLDNSRDAMASKVDISIVNQYCAKLGKDIPILAVQDDGIGMSYRDLRQILSFGDNPLPMADDRANLRVFGRCFKEAALSLGLNILIINQLERSRSVGFLSQSLNRGKKYVETLISYWRVGHAMGVDESFQPSISNKKNLKTLKDHSPFDEFFIGQMCQKFREGQGTLILIWELAKQEGTMDYALQWSKDDILIPGESSRPDQHSLKSYLEYMFLKSTLKLSIQGIEVADSPWESVLAIKEVNEKTVMGKGLLVMLGFSEKEHIENKCGVFLYWNDRLIEAYKKVGTMQSGSGRGVIGAIEVSQLMDQKTLHDTKQKFHNCNAYIELEKWLAEAFDSYWDKNFKNSDPVGPSSPPGDELENWVRCDGCRRWRRLNPDVDIRELPRLWYCFKYPYRGKCSDPQEEMEEGEVQVRCSRPRLILPCSSEED